MLRCHCLLVKSPFTALVLLLGSLSAPERAQAVVVVSLDGLSAGKNVTVTYKGTAENVFAGQYLMRYLGTQNSFSSFCVDFDHFVSLGQSYSVYQRQTSDGLNAGGQIAYLYSTYGLSKLTDDNYAAALQLAIWKRVIDGTTDLNTGNFRYQGTLASLVNNFLSQSQGHSGQTLWLDAGASGSDLYRGQSALAPEPAPVPASVTMLGLGVICLGAYYGLSRGLRKALVPGGP